jgi:hypothetical protein
MKIILDKQLHESNLKNAEYYAKSGTALFLLGKNKEGICDKAIYLLKTEGCDLNPYASSSTITSAYLELYKQDSEPAGFIRLAGYPEFKHFTNSGKPYLGWRSFFLYSNNSNRMRTIVVNYISTKHVAVYQVDDHYKDTEIKLEIK